MRTELENILKERSDQVILAGYMGSISHGTNLHKDDPNFIDDKDVMAVYIPPLNHYLGLSKNDTFRTMQDEWDIVGYEIRKFFSLLLKNNPNVVGLLWLRENHYLKVTPLGQALINHRDIFSSKLAYQAFVGYATSQLHRMTSFQKYEGYMGAKRKALVDKYGYDCKNATHLIRLLTMGYEFLVTGQLNVFREHDNQMLIEIKTGQWDLKRVQNHADSLYKLCLEALAKSPLPDKPNYDRAEQLLTQMISYWHADSVKDNAIDCERSL